MRMLIVTSVQKEADTIGGLQDVDVIVAGVGRVNAACATTAQVIERGPYDLVLSAGVAGALPAERGFAAAIGELIVASRCVYAEEGIITPQGFRNAAELGFPLGDFEGNAVPVDSRCIAAAELANLRVATVATVATCSGTTHAGRVVAERTGAAAEAMEGAAVVHAARRLGVPGGELRAISNTTGDRDSQQWDLERGLQSLESGVRGFIEAMLEGG